MANYTVFTNAAATKMQADELTVGGNPVYGGMALSAAPTTATVGHIGQLGTYSGALYVCTAISGDTYTWKTITLT